MDEIFNTLIQKKLTPNQLYILHCLKHRTVPHSSINISLEIERLKEDDWIEEVNKLTAKSIALLDNLDAYFRKSKKKSNEDVMGIEYMIKIKAYVELFPKGNLPSGKPARSNPKNLETNFRWFFETFDYDWETVSEATKMYLDKFEQENFKYMRTSQYFIRRQNQDKSSESELANYCEMYLNGDVEDNSHFSERVV
jgi:hypothetical protein